MRIHDFPYFTEYDKYGNDFPCSFIKMTAIRFAACLAIMVVCVVLWSITSDAFYQIQALCLYAFYSAGVMLMASIINFLILSGKRTTFWFTGFIIHLLVVFVVIGYIAYNFFIELSEISGMVFLVGTFVLIALIPLTALFFGVWWHYRAVRKKGEENARTREQEEQGA